MMPYADWMREGVGYCGNCGRMESLYKAIVIVVTFALILFGRLRLEWLAYAVRPFAALWRLVCCKRGKHRAGLFLLSLIGASSNPPNPNFSARIVASG